MDAEGRAWLSAVTASTNEAVIAEDAEGRVIAWNRAAEQILGHPAEEVVGVPTSHLMVDLEGRGCAEALGLARTGARVEGVRASCRTRSGRTARLILNAAPIWGEEGSLKGVALVAQEVSDQEEKQQLQIERFIDVAPDAYILVDQDGRIALANPQTEAIFGYGPEELLGETVEKLLPHRFRGRHVAHRSDYSSAPRIRAMGEGLELLGLKKNGDEFPVDISLAPIEIDGRTLMSAAIRDVTERKRAEALTQQAHEAALQRRQALELNDSVVQGLTVALMALALDDRERCLRTLQTTLEAAKHIISEMLVNSEEEVNLEHGELRRSEPVALERPVR